MTTEERLKNQLTATFSPIRLEILNDSMQHAGHAGHDGSGQSHFRVCIVADIFKGKSRIERHRMVNDAVKAEFTATLHALQIEAKAPGEF